jgi:hypothetical protein
MKRQRRIAGLAAATILLGSITACAPARPSEAPDGSGPGPSAAASLPITPGPSPTLDRVVGWRSDLAGLLPAMDAIHPNLTHGTPRAQLDAAVAAASTAVPSVGNDALLVDVLRIVAMVSYAGCDAHTGAFIWGTGSYPVDSPPLRVWLFEDEVVIVDALPPYAGLIGSRIDSVEGTPIGDVLDELYPLIPRDNAQTLRLLAPRYLLIPQVLRGLGLADEGDVTLGLTDDAGARQAVDVAPISMADYNAWAGPYGLHLPADANVEYLSRIDEALWWKRLPDVETLFVQYNRVDRLPSATLSDLKSALHAPDVARVILDMRHNFGGEVEAIDPILTLFKDPAFDRPGRLAVITGRNTFSAASLMVARLDQETSATFVGEAMGGCPTAYGDSSDVTLPFSGIVVSVAGMLEVGVSADDTRQTIEPYVLTELTRSAWEDDRDPAREAIVGIGP